MCGQNKAADDKKTVCFDEIYLTAALNYDDFRWFSFASHDYNYQQQDTEKNEAKLPLSGDSCVQQAEKRVLRGRDECRITKLAQCAVEEKKRGRLESARQT